ncbi:hypothetical protein [Proteiniclasticum sp. QWL-01]|uniref:hypothetical protein n=1 Tax=Proteiniclasticum sp. QWL-01 TaxID=3036945 RepID=UPI00220B1B86|nr:hypothetical protein [Proteiniclasticum sp. QWL-01]UUM12513.1 hypothetical protein NQU17_02815 [Clostridiaceae bacterium HFYG-1003]WFF74078.1 hypothetical protein P6M73_06405 [Proteiniclasticum sp. QWL-01]
MDHEFKPLLRSVIQVSLFVALPLAGLSALIWGGMAGLALLLGSLVATGGFLLSVRMTAAAIRSGGVFLTVLLHFGKILITVLVAWLLISIQPVLGIFYFVGYTLLFGGILLYTKKLT